MGWVGYMCYGIMDDAGGVSIASEVGRPVGRHFSFTRQVRSMFYSLSRVLVQVPETGTVGGGRRRRWGGRGEGGSGESYLITGPGFCDELGRGLPEELVVCLTLRIWHGTMTVLVCRLWRSEGVSLAQNKIGNNTGRCTRCNLGRAF